LYTTIKYIFATNETMFATFAILGTMKFFTWLRGYHNGKEPFLSQLLRLCLVIVFVGAAAAVVSVVLYLVAGN
jgi:hypothetical protein